MLAKIKQILSTEHSALLFTTILIVNVGNYLINLVLGRVLGPEAFAEAGIIATGVLILSFIALGFQMTAAKFTAEYAAENELGKMSAFSKWFSRKSWYLGLGLALLVAGTSWAMKSFLHFESVWPFFIIALGVPLYLKMSTNRGILQGRLTFRKLAGTYLLEMVGRLGVTFVLLLLLFSLGGGWTTEAVAMGFLAAFLAAFWGSRPKSNQMNIEQAAFDNKQVVRFMLIVGGYEFSQILISHSDLILVKHYFTNEEAGWYTALALIGRIVFFATWSVVTLLFPKVIQLEKKGLPHQHLFYRSLSIVVGVGFIITVGCFFFDELIISILFGAAFSSASQLLWLYAAATTLFATANVFTYYYLSLNKYLPVLFSGLAGVLQILLINFFHDSLARVIYVQILVMSILFFGMIIFHTLKNANHEKVENRTSYALSAQ